MAVSTGDLISAAQYNGLQSRISTVLGTGAGNYGYGQPVGSGQVTTSTDTITADQLDLLRADMSKAYVHQNGANIPVRNVSVGDVIGADVSGTDIEYDSLGAPTVINSDITGGFNDYLDIMDDLETYRFTIDDSEDTITDIAADTRTSSWNNSINMEFTATFTDEDHRRYFFNSGGEIRIYLGMTNAVSSKDTNWSTILTNPGTVVFGHNYTTVTGSTTGVTLNSLGNYDLTTSNQLVFTKTGNSGVYAENNWTVNVKRIGTNQIVFTVTLTDADTGDEPITPVPVGGIPGGVDENVTGDVTANLATRRASGSNVSVNGPVVSITNTFE